MCSQYKAIGDNIYNGANFNIYRIFWFIRRGNYNIIGNTGNPV